MMDLLALSQSPRPQTWTLQSYLEEARLSQRHNEWEKAATLYYFLNSQQPHIFPIQFQLGICQMNLEHWEGAIQTFQGMMNIHNIDADVVCNLAISFWKNHQLKQALSHFKFNLKQFPFHLETRENLAAFYLEFERMEKAMEQYHIMLHQDSNQLDIEFNLAACLQQKGIYDEAIYHYLHILHLSPRHFDTLYNLGCVHYALNNPKAANFYWQQCLEQQPKHPALLFMTQRMQGLPVNQVHHQAYVKELFNHYATHYENHLMKQLNYKLPQRLDLFLNSHFTLNQFQNVLEVGCGTGLCSPIIKPFSQSLIGIDIAEKMIEKAKKCRDYDETHTFDALSYLTQHPQSFDLILAIDVIPYLFDLEAWMRACKQALRPGGYLLFTTEISKTGPFSLEPTGRLSFHPETIQKICIQQQMTIITQERVIARTQNNMPVPELFYLIQTPND
ncbi:MAG: methyltransferase domain-containing protein [Gammaproteobacteria bacterium]|nr:methyltransferase domain-containing protein [Gammaproteobacteria bacterium]